MTPVGEVWTVIVISIIITLLFIGMWRSDSQNERNKKAE